MVTIRYHSIALSGQVQCHFDEVGSVGPVQVRAERLRRDRCVPENESTPSMGIVQKNTPANLHGHRHGPGSAAKQGYAYFSSLTACTTLQPPHALTFLMVGIPQRSRRSRRIHCPLNFEHGPCQHISLP